MEKADLSTFLHELGHSWIEELKVDAARENSPDQVKTDCDTIKAWLGVKGDAITTELHEQFARGAEAYLMEGNAPSTELQQIFQRFAAWLKMIYRELRGLNVRLNDDVRGVFDRLLASEEEIRIARQAQGMVDLFTTAEDAGMTEAEFRAYRKQAERAHVEEVERLDKALLAELSREQKAWWKEAREAMRAVVEEEAQAAPVYRAIRLLSTGKMFDGTEGEVLKFSREDLVRMYGEPFLKRLPRGFNHIYSKEGGVHPDVAAELFGFESGDEMVRAMVEASPISKWIEAETDMRMRETYADLQAAVDAVAQRPQDWKQLTMDEFLAVNDAVMNLWELSRRTRQMEIDGRMVDRDMVIGELSGRLEEIGLPESSPATTRRWPSGRSSGPRWSASRRRRPGLGPGLRPWIPGTRTVPSGVTFGSRSLRASTITA